MGNSRGHTPVAEMIELVLEDVPVHGVDGLAHALFERKDVVSIFMSEDSSLDLEKFSWNFGEKVSSGDEAEVIAVSVDAVSVGSITLENALVQIIGYSGKVDFSISFDSPSCCGSEWFRSLERGVIGLSKEFCFGKFTCGYEPASDPVTTFFSEAGEGSLLSRL